MPTGSISLKSKEGKPQTFPNSLLLLFACARSQGPPRWPPGVSFLGAPLCWVFWGAPRIGGPW
ncbi:hypothetical protein ENH_00059050 [Eimeria necatrix]|uniref:Uncharacterized protein n=1 Tax=Eimeria necatrix TaxID=51315 RepID=U6MIC4_9EIME|nr:hypothetical protein ENH_00059050 [Eimeria necatrix]CDJ63771.1 hypothetical protein ENH_00059050 [Eimeria necatrix]